MSIWLKYNDVSKIGAADSLAASSKLPLHRQQVTGICQINGFNHKWRQPQAPPQMVMSYRESTINFRAMPWLWTNPNELKLPISLLNRSTSSPERTPRLSGSHLCHGGTGWLRDHWSLGPKLGNHVSRERPPCGSVYQTVETHFADEIQPQGLKSLIHG